MKVVLLGPKSMSLKNPGGKLPWVLDYCPFGEKGKY
jgi:hypothetical protein